AEAGDPGAGDRHAAPVPPSAPGGPVWGEVGLRSFDPAAGRAEVGWWIASAQRGRGLASSAVDLLSAWALGPPLGLRQVWARIDPANHAAARVAHRVGFARLGHAGGSDVWARAAAIVAP
ncbi:MAG: GNAT family N-acetyltransferase, partial [Acidimicrobiia bacterium]